MKYNKAGWVEDLPSLITGRKYHGCSHYTDTSDRLVSRAFSSSLSLLIASVQVYMVAGGENRVSGLVKLNSAEILVAGTYAWTAVNPLPQPYWNMRMVSLNNIPYMFGQR